MHRRQSRERPTGLLAREYLRAGYAEDAEPLLRAELQTGGDAETRQLLATALSVLGRNTEAERRYREALALDPGSVRAHYNLASLLAADGRPRDASSAGLYPLPWPNASTLGAR